MMDTDKRIEEIFQEFRPDTGGETDFMAALNRRLDAVEYVKRRQDAQLRRYKYALLGAFASGLVAGAVCFGLITALPDQALELSTNLSPLLLVVGAKTLRYVVLCLLSVGMGFGVVALLNTFYDVMALRDASRQALP